MIGGGADSQIGPAHRLCAGLDGLFDFTAGGICAVNRGYTGYSLVRHMRAMVARGDLGAIRLVKAEFAHAHHADEADANNPRVHRRYDPKQAGVSAQFADCGIHAPKQSLVTGQQVTRLPADTVSCIASRELEDDAMLSDTAEPARSDHRARRGQPLARTADARRAART